MGCLSSRIDYKPLNDWKNDCGNLWTRLFGRKQRRRYRSSISRMKFRTVKYFNDLRRKTAKRLSIRKKKSVVRMRDGRRLIGGPNQQETEVGNGNEPWYWDYEGTIEQHGPKDVKGEQHVGTSNEEDQVDDYNPLWDHYDTMHEELSDWSIAYERARKELIYNSTPPTIITPSMGENMVDDKEAGCTDAPRPVITTNTLKVEKDIPKRISTRRQDDAGETEEYYLLIEGRTPTPSKYVPIVPNIVVKGASNQHLTIPRSGYIVDDKRGSSESMDKVVERLAEGNRPRYSQNKKNSDKKGKKGGTNSNNNNSNRNRCYKTGTVMDGEVSGIKYGVSRRQLKSKHYSNPDGCSGEMEYKSLIKE